MRAIPDFADVTALLRQPLSRAALTRGRIVAGSVAAAGSLAFVLGAPGHAEAKPMPAGKTAAVRPSTTAAPRATAAVLVDSYTIRSGDTLSGIALQRNLSVQAIASANNIADIHRIRAGDRLSIPTARAAAARAPLAEAAVPLPAPKPVPAPRGNDALLAVPYKASAGGPLPKDLAGRPERLKLRSAFLAAASEYRVPAEVLEAMDWNESGWQNTVVSGTGAIGVGQLMPDTITFVNETLVKRPLDPRKPEQNVRMSAAFLRYLVDQNHGDYRMALASYYQGLRSLRENGPYSDTVQYVRTVLAIQRAYF